MPINVIINSRVMAGNPVIALLYAGAQKSARYRLYKHDGTGYNILAYEGIVYTAYQYARVDISSLFAEQRYTASVNKYMVVLVTDEGTEYDAVAFNVFGGSVSKMQLRNTGAGDIFTYKLKNQNSNFFLTSRSSDSIINIPEDEIMPMYYYGSGMKLTVKSDGATLLTIDYMSETTSEVLHSIDFKTLRENYAVSNNKLVSSFDIVSDTSYSCSVVISESKKPTHFYLKYKNSWGAYEKIGIRGRIDFVPTYGEVKKNRVFDATINDYITTTDRKTMINTLNASSGTLNDSERMMMIDLMLSNEVVLIAYGKEYAVMVSTDSTLYSSSESEPIDINFKIELQDDENSFSPMPVQAQYGALATTSLQYITSNGSTIIV